MSNNAELKRLRAELENTWRISEEIGQPTPEHIRVYELIRLEMGFRTKIEVAMNVASLAGDWIETRNPFCVDRAVVTCFAAGVEPSPSLQALIAQVAYRRLRGEIGAGTPETLANDAAKQSTLLFVANLIHSGETLQSACSKGAARHSQVYPHLKRLKASTLDRYYSNVWRKKGPDGQSLEHTMFERWGKYEYKDDAARAEWKRIAEATPEADDELKGERR